MGAGPFTRRSILTWGGGALFVSAASALSGCSVFSDADARGRANYDVPERTTAATSSPDTDLVSFGSVVVPEVGDPNYRRWLPAPSEVIDRPKDNWFRPRSYSISFVDLEWIREHRPFLPRGYAVHRFLGKLDLDFFGIGFSQYRRVIRVAFDRVVIVEADIDRSHVASTLIDTGYESAGRHLDYRIFARTDDPRAVGVGDEALIYANTTGGTYGLDPSTAVKTVVDAARSETPRYHDTDPGFDRLSRHAGGPPIGLVWNTNRWAQSPTEAPVLPNVAGSADTFLFDDEATYLRRVIAFDRAMAQDPLRRNLRVTAADERLFRMATSVEVSVSGRWASITGSIPDDRYAAAFESSTDITYPQITWSFSHDRSGDTWTISMAHEAGDEIPVETLAVHLVVPRGHQRTTDVISEDAMVGPGDVLTVTFSNDEVARPHKVRLVWHAPDGSAASSLGTYEYQ